MNAEMRSLLTGANQAIVKYRGTYARWASLHHIGYNEMLVLYTINESGFCTQKQLCDDYHVPRQTIHNVISSMRKAELICVSKKHCSGREKAFVLTPRGQEYAAPLLDDISAIEESAINHLGAERLKELSKLMNEYDAALNDAMQSRM